MENEIRVTVSKPLGLGPYLWVLNWKAENGTPMSSVFSHWEDMDARLRLLEQSGREIVNWDLAVDRTRKTHA